MIRIVVAIVITIALVSVAYAQEAKETEAYLRHMIETAQSKQKRFSAQQLLQRAFESANDRAAAFESAADRNAPLDERIKLLVNYNGVKNWIDGLVLAASSCEDAQLFVPKRYALHLQLAIKAISQSEPKNLMMARLFAKDAKETYIRLATACNELAEAAK